MGVTFALCLSLLLFQAPTERPVYMPDPILTPGEVRPLTLAQICGTKWGTDRRFVSEAMKRHVLRAYGMTWEQRGDVEIDHLQPRSLAGSDDILNLFPMPWAGEWGARRKDVLERRLSVMACKGEIPLAEAQRAIRVDWVAAYKRYVK